MDKGLWSGRRRTQCCNSRGVTVYLQSKVFKAGQCTEKGDTSCFGEMYYNFRVAVDGMSIR